MHKAPRNEHEAWGVLWATLERSTANRLPDRGKPPTARKGPFTYQAPIAPPISPLRAILRLAGATLIATLCALLTFS